ncbi:hypothetical protein [Paenibacillus sp. TH7-28]
MHSIGTGSHWWAYVSMQMVKLSFHELISDIKRAAPLEHEKREWGEDKQLIEHKLLVLHDLLELKLSSPLSPLGLFMELKRNYRNCTRSSSNGAPSTRMIR